MFINDDTVKNIDGIVKNEIGLSVMDLCFLTDMEQQQIISERYNKEERIKHYYEGKATTEKTRSKMNKEFDEVFKEKKLGRL